MKTERVINGKTLSRRDFLRFSGAGLAGAALLGTAACGGGQTGQGGGWEPSQDVSMIVPAGAGGGADVMGRAMAAGFEEVRPDVTVVVENRPGGAGAVGMSYLLEQSGNPHYLVAAETAIITVPILNPDVPFTREDFTPLALLGEDAAFFAVLGDAPYESLPDAIEAARQQGGATIAGVLETGFDRVVTQLLAEDQNVELERVVFQSGADSLSALLGGDVDFALLSPSDAIGQLEAGDVRALAVFREERYSEELLSDVPTAREEGVDVAFPQFRGPFIAGGISDAERTYWEEAITEWSESEGYDEYINNNRILPRFLTGQEFEDYLREYESTARNALEGS